MKKKTAASKSASALQIIAAIVLICTSAILLASSLTPQSGAPQPVSQTGGFPAPYAAVSGPAAKNGVVSVPSYKNDMSPPLREMAINSAPIKLSLSNCELKENPKTGIKHKDAPDGALQDASQALKGLQSPNIPATTLNFDGIPFPGVVCNCAPPDPDGAVGLNQYVEEVNEGIQVFNKSTGASELGPIAISSLWTGFGGVCEFNGHGDGIILYDHFANRWMISQFAGSSNPTDECVAVSTSADATGSYYRYGFHLGTNYFDYPKIGIWPDAYYMSMNVFNAAGTTFLGPQPFALDRTNMLLGNPATFVSPVGPLGGTIGPILPLDIDGPTLPASGAPETFVGFPAAGNYIIYHFHVDFGTPANSTWTTFATPAAAAFTQLCSTGTNTRACVPQSGETTSVSGLDGIGDRLIHRAAYRNFGDHESVVTTYSVCATGACGAAGTGSGTSGVRWIELRNPTSGPVTVFQENTYQPDTTWRWLGSAAMDNAGDIAVGYSVSSSTIVPGIRYAGRLSTDPVNTLAQGEAVLFAGVGSQSSTGNRWGDYSAMSVDPEDDCTFWYTNEYYPTGASQFNWRNRIGNFAFTQCVPATAQPVAAVSVYKTADAASINPGTTAGFKVTVNSSGTATANGLSFTDNLPSGGGINWSLDGANTDPGWSISGSPPNQSLVFAPTTMPAGTSLKAHVISSTSPATCGSTLSNTAMISSSNGGSGSATATIVLDCTNCTPNAWTDNSPQLAVPANIMDQGAAALGNSIYMFSGVSNGAIVNTARKYDSVANTWTTLTVFPASVESPVTVCDVTQWCYTMGGTTGTAQTTTRRYDTVANTYTSLTAFTTGRWAAGAAFFNGKIYLMGGWNSAGTTAQTSLQIGTLSGSPPTVTWAAGTAMPVGLSWPQVVGATVGGVNYIYVSGGTTASGDQNTVYRYNITANTWATVGTMPATVWSASNGIVNGFWVLAGGYVNGNPSSNTYTYNFSTNTWTLNASSMVQPRGRGAGAAVGGTKLFSLGGRNDATFNGTNDNQKYLPSLCPPGLLSVVSRMTHGGSGTFDLTLSTSSRVVEPRTNLNSPGSYTIVFNFNEPVSSGTATTTGSVGSATTSFSGNSMIVALTGVSDQQNVTVTANNVSGPGTGTLASVSTEIGFLIGDVNQNPPVNVGDTVQVRNNAGVTLDNTNFLNDVNTDGAVNVGDTTIVRNNSGNTLPPP
ncbi:MAG TPA: kelch repeat-containing protein [Chthoniobacterales bacterium]|nr:kelch repeat-containing protein [Chthoniobacterales bacterium]